jgi:hypothetical protein
MEDFVTEYLRKQAIAPATPEQLELAKVWMGKLKGDELDKFFFGFISQEFSRFCSDKNIDPTAFTGKTMIETFEYIWALGRESGYND